MRCAPWPMPTRLMRTSFLLNSVFLGGLLDSFISFYFLLMMFILRFFSLIYIRLLIMIGFNIRMFSCNFFGCNIYVFKRLNKKRGEEKKFYCLFSLSLYKRTRASHFCCTMFFSLQTALLCV